MARPNYLKNILKSIVFTAADVVTSLVPNTKEFAEQNKDFVKQTFTSIRLPKMGARRRSQGFIASKIFEPINYVLGNLSQDLKTGDFYAAKRKEADEMKAMGMDDFGDDFNFDFDEGDLENAVEEPTPNETVTTGDLKITDAVEGASMASTQTMVQAIIGTTETSMKNTRATTAMVFEQNERLMGGLHTDLINIGGTIRTLYDMQSQVFGNIDQNLSKYETDTLRLHTERNELLKQWFEWEKTEAQTAKEKEEKALADTNQKAKKRATDFMYNGIPNLQEYMESIQKNITDAFSLFQVGDNTSLIDMLKVEYGAAPIRSALTAALEALTPKEMKDGAKKLDAAVSNIFPNIISAINRRANSFSLDGPFGFFDPGSIIAKWFGLDTSFSKKLDPSKYEKGKVAWDGIARKALIDVIPSYLAKIEAHLSGEGEFRFDYNTGKFKSLKKAKEEFDESYRQRARSAFYDMSDAFNQKLINAKAEAFVDNGGVASEQEIKEFNKAVDDFKLMYVDAINQGKDFFTNRSASENGIYADTMPELAKYFKFIAKAFDQLPKELTTSLTKAAFDAGTEHNRDLRQKETIGAGPATALFQHDNKDVKIISATGKGGLLSSKDSYGNSIYDYLRNINAELVYLNQYNEGSLTSAIPGYLSRIESIMTGRPEMRFDHTTGQWQTMRSQGLIIPGAQNQTEAYRQRIDNTLQNIEGESRETLGDSSAIQGNTREERINKIFQSLRSPEQVKQDKETAKKNQQRTESITTFQTQVLADLLRDANANDIRVVKDVDDESDSRKGEDIRNYLLKLGEYARMPKEGEEDKLKKEYEDQFRTSIDNNAPELKQLRETLQRFITKGHFEKSQERLLKAIKRAKKHDEEAEIERQLQEENPDYEVDPEKLETAKVHEIYDDDTFTERLLKRLKLDKVRTWFGSITKKVTDTVVTIADKTNQWIYDMFFQKHYKKDGKEYNGFIDFLVDKTIDAFGKFKDLMQEKVIDPFKKMLGIDDSFKSRMKSAFGNIFETMWGGFTSANRRVWYNPMMDYLLSKEKTHGILANIMPGEIRKGIARSDETKTKNFSQKELESYDKEREEVLSQEGGEDEWISKTGFKLGNIVSFKIRYLANLGENPDLLKGLLIGLSKDEQIEVLNKRFLEIDKKLRPEYGKMQREAQATAEQIQKEQLEKLEEMGEAEPAIEDTGLAGALRDTLETDVNAYDDTDIGGYGDEIGRAKGTIGLKQLAIPIKHKAKGTTPSGKPFIGKSMLTRGEMAITKYGTGIVPETGLYEAETPTHILNNRDTAQVLDGLNVKNVRDISVQQAESEEAKAEKQIFTHKAKGTISAQNMFSDIDKSPAMKEIDKAEKGYLKEIGVSEKEVQEQETEDQKEQVQHHAKGSRKGFDDWRQMMTDQVRTATEKGRKMYGKAKGYYDKAKQNESFAAVIEGIKTNVPELLAGGAVGGGISLLLGLAGGPLLGAAVGAGTMLVTKSEKLQNILFGKMGENGEREDTGLISKKVQDAVKKYAPDMFDYSMAGLLGSLFLPFGPVAGVMIGSSIGYLKNNDEMRKSLFGKLGLGVIDDDMKGLIKNMIPNTAKGAILGGVATLFGGPFGLVGNMMLGGGIGLMTSTEEFKTQLLGTLTRSGARVGGIVGALKDAFEPLKQAGREFKDKIIYAIDDNIIDPLKRFIVPAIYALPQIAAIIPRKINDWFEKGFGIGLDTVLDKWVISPLKKTFKPLANFGANLFKMATSPFKLLGTAGDAIKKKQIETNNAAYMTAEERMKFRAENNMGDNVFDEVLASIGSESFSLKDAKKFQKQLETITSNQRELGEQRIAANEVVLNKIRAFKTPEGDRISATTIDRVKKAINAGKMDEIPAIIGDGTLSNSKRALSAEERNILMKDSGLGQDIIDYKDLNRRYYQSKDISEQQRKNASKEVQEALGQLGIDNIDFSDTHEVNKILAMLNTEITRAEKEKGEGLETTAKAEAEDVHSILNYIEQIVKTGITLKEEGSEESKAAKIADQIALEAGTSVADRHAESRKVAAIKQYTQEELDQMTPEERTHIEQTKTSLTGLKKNTDRVDKNLKLKNSGLFNPNLIDRFRKESDENIERLLRIFDNKYRDLRTVFEKNGTKLTSDDVDFLIKQSNDRLKKTNQLANRIIESGRESDYTSLASIANMSGEQITQTVSKRADQPDIMAITPETFSGSNIGLPDKQIETQNARYMSQEEIDKFKAGQQPQEVQTQAKGTIGIKQITQKEEESKSVESKPIAAKNIFDDMPIEKPTVTNLLETKEEKPIIIRGSQETQTGILRTEKTSEKASIEDKVQIPKEKKIDALTAIEPVKHHAKGSSTLETDITDNAGKITAGATLGAGAAYMMGIGGLVGGPLLGAAVGAGMTLLSKSQTIQEALFGKLDKSGRRDNSGLISGDLQRVIQKHFPSMAKGGLMGLIASTILPFGPVAGVILGSSLEFLKSNEEFRNKLLGNLGIDDKKRKWIADHYMGGKRGAAIGAMVGAIGGPFGILGSAAIGAGIGLLTTTDTFKDTVFGKKDQWGKRHGGVVGGFKDAFKDAITTPLKQIWHPLKRGVIDLATWIPRKFTKIFGDTFKGGMKYIFGSMGDSIRGIVKGAIDAIPENVRKGIKDTLGKVLSPVTKGLKYFFKDGFLKGVGRTLFHGGVGGGLGALGGLLLGANPLLGAAVGIGSTFVPKALASVANAGTRLQSQDFNTKGQSATEITQIQKGNEKTAKTYQALAELESGKLENKEAIEQILEYQKERQKILTDLRTEKDAKDAELRKLMEGHGLSNDAILEAIDVSNHGKGIDLSENEDTGASVLKDQLRKLGPDISEAITKALNKSAERKANLENVKAGKTGDMQDLLAKFEDSFKKLGLSKEQVLDEQTMKNLSSVTENSLEISKQNVSLEEEAVDYARQHLAKLTNIEKLIEALKDVGISLNEEATKRIFNKIWDQNQSNPIASDSAEDRVLGLFGKDTSSYDVMKNTGGGGSKAAADAVAAEMGEFAKGTIGIKQLTQTQKKEKKPIESKPITTKETKVKAEPIIPEIVTEKPLKKEDIQHHFLGSLLGGLSGIGGSILGGISSLFTPTGKIQTSKMLEQKAAQAATPQEAVTGAPTGGAMVSLANSDLDKTGDNKTTYMTDQGPVTMVDNGDGPKPDTDDTTKETLNKKTLAERAAEKARNAAITSSNILSKAFGNGSENERKKGKGMGWLGTLLLGGALWKTGILGNIWDGIKPWLLDTAIPKAGELLGEAVASGTKLLIEALPGILKGSWEFGKSLIKGLWTPVMDWMDSVTGHNREKTATHDTTEHIGGGQKELGLQSGYKTADGRELTHEELREMVNNAKDGENIDAYSERGHQLRRSGVNPDTGEATYEHDLGGFSGEGLMQTTARSTVNAIAHPGMARFAQKTFELGAKASNWLGKATKLKILTKPIEWTSKALSKIANPVNAAKGFVGWLTSGLQKIFNSGAMKWILNKVPFVNNLGDKVAEAVTKMINKFAEKSAAKVGTSKIAAAMSRYAPLLGQVLFMTDLASGYSEAGYIMGVTDPTSMQCVCAALGRAICNYSVIFSVWPGEAKAIQFLYTHLASEEEVTKYEKQLAETEDEYQTYKDAGGDLEKDDWLSRKGSWGSFKGFFVDLFRGDSHKRDIADKIAKFRWKYTKKLKGSKEFIQSCGVYASVENATRLRYLAIHGNMVAAEIYIRLCVTFKTDIISGKNLTAKDYDNLYKFYQKFVLDVYKDRTDEEIEAAAKNMQDRLDADNNFVRDVSQALETDEHGNTRLTHRDESSNYVKWKKTANLSDEEFMLKYMSSYDIEYYRELCSQAILGRAAEQIEIFYRATILNNGKSLVTGRDLTDDNLRFIKFLYDTIVLGIVNDTISDELLETQTNEIFEGKKSDHMLQILKTRVQEMKANERSWDRWIKDYNLSEMSEADKKRLGYTDDLRNRTEKPTPIKPVKFVWLKVTHDGGFDETVSIPETAANKLLEQAEKANGYADWHSDFGQERVKVERIDTTTPTTAQGALGTKKPKTARNILTQVQEKKESIYAKGLDKLTDTDKLMPIEQKRPKIPEMEYIPKAAKGRQLPIFAKGIDEDFAKLSPDINSYASMGYRAIPAEALENIKSSSLKTLIITASGALIAFLDKLFTSGFIVNSIKAIVNWLGKSQMVNLISQFCTRIKNLLIPAFQRALTKISETEVYKMVARIQPYTKIAFAVWDALDGIDRAEAIVGVTQPTPLDHLIAAITQFLLGQFASGMLYYTLGTEYTVQLIYRAASSIFNLADYKRRYVETEKLYQEYIKQPGNENVTKIQWLTKEYSYWGKLMSMFSDFDLNAFQAILSPKVDYSRKRGLNGTIKRTIPVAPQTWRRRGLGTLKKSKPKALPRYGTGYAKQIDPAIADLSYNIPGDSELQTYYDSACGPVTAVNMLENITGQSMGPSAVQAAGEAALAGGYKEIDGGTDFKFHQDYLKQNGIDSEVSYDKSKIESNIRAGKPTTLMIEEKPRTATGSFNIFEDENIPSLPKSPKLEPSRHYVTATGITEDGKMIIQDPENPMDNVLYAKDDIMNRSLVGVSATGLRKTKFGRGEPPNMMNQAVLIRNYLRQKGYSDNAIYGILGNMEVESGLRPKRVEMTLISEIKKSGKTFGMDVSKKGHDFDEEYTKALDTGQISREEFLRPSVGAAAGKDKRGYGLVQFTSADKKGLLYDATIKKGKSIGDLSSQLDAFDDYLANSYLKKLHGILKDPNITPAKAADEMVRRYEVPADINNTAKDRINRANLWAQKLSGNPDATMPGPADPTSAAIPSEGADPNKPVPHQTTYANAPADGSRETATTSSSSEGGVSAILSELSNAFSEIINQMLGLPSSKDNAENSATNTTQPTSTGDTSTGGPSAVPDGTTDGSPSTAGDISVPREGGDPAKMIAIAKGELGTQEDPYDSNKIKYNDWFFGKKGVAAQWCNIFISWLANQAGISQSVIPKASYTPDSFGKILKSGGKEVKVTEAIPGDLMYFTGKKDRPYGVYHIGLVTGRQGNKVATIEGNTSSKGSKAGVAVAEKVRGGQIRILRPNYADPGKPSATPQPEMQLGEVEANSYAATRGGNVLKNIKTYGALGQFGRGSQYDDTTRTVKNPDGSYDKIEVSGEDLEISRRLQVIDEKLRRHQDVTKQEASKIMGQSLSEPIAKKELKDESQPLTAKGTKKAKFGRGGFKDFMSNLFGSFTQGFMGQSKPPIPSSQIQTPGIIPQMPTSTQQQSITQLQQQIPQGQSSVTPTPTSQQQRSPITQPQKPSEQTPIKPEQVATPQIPQTPQQVQQQQTPGFNMGNLFESIGGMFGEKGSMIGGLLSSLSNGTKPTDIMNSMANQFGQQMGAKVTRQQPITQLQIPNRLQPIQSQQPGQAAPTPVSQQQTIPTTLISSQVTEVTKPAVSSQPTTVLTSNPVQQPIPQKPSDVVNQPVQEQQQPGQAPTQPQAPQQMPQPVTDLPTMKGMVGEFLKGLVTTKVNNEAVSNIATNAIDVITGDKTMTSKELFETIKPQIEETVFKQLEQTPIGNILSIITKGMMGQQQPMQQPVPQKPSDVTKSPLPIDAQSMFGNITSGGFNPFSLFTGSKDNGGILGIAGNILGGLLSGQKQAPAATIPQAMQIPAQQQIVKPAPVVPSIGNTNIITPKPDVATPQAQPQQTPQGQLSVAPTPASQQQTTPITVTPAQLQITEVSKPAVSTQPTSAPTTQPTQQQLVAQTQKRPMTAQMMNRPFENVTASQSPLGGLLSGILGGKMQMPSLGNIAQGALGGVLSTVTGGMIPGATPQQQPMGMPVETVGATIDYTQLMKQIIEILTTVSKNTDNLNTMTQILQQQSGLKITPQMVANTQNGNSLSERLGSRINQTATGAKRSRFGRGVNNAPTNIASTEGETKLKAYADNIENDNLTAIQEIMSNLASS